MEDKTADWEVFPCDSCGATLRYAPGTESLTCPYCGHVNPINEIHLGADELDYEATLRRLAAAQPAGDDEIVIHCDECGAAYRLEDNTHAGQCEFCGANVVAETRQHRQLEPQGVLPFQITREQAETAFQRWLGRLWLAPRGLKQYARHQRKLSGIYIPYWTFDSESEAAYQGMRGTYYQTPERFVTEVNGRRQVVTRMVTRVRWTPVAGRVSREFDDVLIEASFSLPRKILRRLNRWNLKFLKKYNKAYLSGFKSEMYQAGPRQGFQQATQIMEEVLRADIARDIGGDLQKITRMQSHFDDVTFKHILLPVWVAAYKYRGKSYRFVVNGQNGEVQGERPYSGWKILLLILAALGLAAGFFWFAENSGMLEQIQYPYQSPMMYP
ncbi:MAG TPA: primosomal protein N' (replication factor Y) - superfamily II helicase [Gammaproteobacteria bacterium]|nr:primosomal protein N' (replication factor Y) - superfamily II helicase [Gammaproteobacteria bacterium]